jgi:hypothetical protein
MYNERQQHLRKLREDQAYDYYRSTSNAIDVQQESKQMKEITEERIKRLEEEEMNMLTKRQQTMQQKDKAIEDLASKSPALKKTLEPRGAYVRRAS